MAKIVYFLGAGASAQAIPPINNFIFRLRFFDYFFKVILDEYTVDGTTKTKLLERLNQYTELIALSQNHISIDTLAKKLFLKEDWAKLVQLKELISLFLIFEHYHIDDYDALIEQYIAGLAHSSKKEIKKLNSILRSYQNKTTDFRYDAFIAAVSNKNITNNLFLPSNISVISWNYDIQLELALDYYDLFRARNLNYMFNPFEYENQEIRFEFQQEFIKLNGSAGYFLTNEEDLNSMGITDPLCKTQFQSIYEIYGRKYSIKELLLSILNKYVDNNNINRMRPYINFAWEENKISNALINRAKVKMNEADSIVILGYSFPTFNREVDCQLFTNLDLGKNCKIYVQTISEKEYNSIKTRILGISYQINEKDIEFIDDISQFYIPFEFSREVEKQGTIKWN